MAAPIQKILGVEISCDNTYVTGTWIIVQGDNTVKFIYGNTFRYGTRGLWVPGSNGMGNSEILCFETTLLR